MQTSAPLISPWRGIGLILAAMALCLKLAVPAGFMVAPAGDAFQLVICSDQGIVSAPDDGHAPTPQAGDHDKPCVFSGHGQGLEAPTLAVLPGASFVRYVRPEVLAAVDLTPGRGLAAPPPPSQGPPSQQI